MAASTSCEPRIVLSRHRGCASGTPLLVCCRTVDPLIQGACAGMSQRPSGVCSNDSAAGCRSCYLTLVPSVVTTDWKGLDLLWQTLQQMPSSCICSTCYAAAAALTINQAKAVVGMRAASSCQMQPAVLTVKRNVDLQKYIHTNMAPSQALTPSLFAATCKG